jgi:hypothetical protein
LASPEAMKAAREQESVLFKSWLEGSEWWDRLLSADAINFAFEAWLVAKQGARERVLAEAKWWRHLVIMHEESYFAVEGDKRIKQIEGEH